MKLPVIKGVIDRRVLVNWRVEAEVLARILPAPFRPQVVGGFGVAGICLIRLREIRPAFLPAIVGIGSENAAHRIAVEWDEDGEVRRGVYVARRDSNSRFNVLVGGRVFPGVHHRATFRTVETAGSVNISVESADGVSTMGVAGEVCDELPEGSVFGSMEEASTFFEAGAVGYSPAREAGRFEGLELRCKAWRARPLHVTRVESSFFSDRERIPEGAAAFDCALLMSGIEHEWHSRGQLCAPCEATAEVGSSD